MAARTLGHKKSLTKKTGSKAMALVSTPRGGSMLAMRKKLNIPRKTFARMLPISERSLAGIESGEKPNEGVSRGMTELNRLIEALSEIVDASALGEWFDQPNEAFDGLKPLEIIERGEIDRLWEMVYLLRSGVAV